MKADKPRHMRGFLMSEIQYDHEATRLGGNRTRLPGRVALKVANLTIRCEGIALVS